MSLRRVLATAAAAVLVLAAAPPAAATTTLPGFDAQTVVTVPGTDLIAVAAEHEGVLVAGTDLAVRGSVAGVRDVRSVFATPDGIVWAGSPEQREVVAIDPHTRSVRTRHALPADVCPGSVAVTGPFVVFGYSCFNFADSGPVGGDGIGVLDTRTGALRLEPGMITPMVTASAALPGRALVIDQGSYSTKLRVLDVSTGTPTVVASRYFDVAKVWDLQVSPDGALVALADMNDAAVRLYRTSDLSLVGAYDVLVGSPRAVAWASPTRVVVGVNDVDEEHAGVVFDVGQPTPRTTLSWTPGTERFVCERCLTVAPGGGRVVLASVDRYDAVTHLESYGLGSSSLTLTSAETPTVAAPFRLDLQLRREDGTAAAAGTTVQVLRAPQYATGEPELVGTAVLDAAGVATLTDRPYDSGWTTWTARWAGDATHAAATASLTREVARAPAQLSVAFERGAKKGKTLYGTLVVRLSPVVESRTVRIEARTSSGTRSLGEHALDSGGTLRLAQSLSTATTYEVTFYGAPRQHDAFSSVRVVP